MRPFLALAAVLAIAALALTLLRSPGAKPPTDPPPAELEPGRAAKADGPELEPIGDAAGLREEVTATTAPTNATATLAARVTGPDDAGIFGVDVWCKIPGAAPGADVSGRTDPEGECELEVPAGEALVLRAQKVRETGAATLDVAPLSPGELREVVLQVTTREETRAEVTVRVRDAEGLPVAGASVFTERTNWQSSGRPTVVPPRGAPAAVTDSGGEARVPTEGFATTVATVVADGFSPRLKALRSSRDDRGPMEAVEIELARAARVEGRATGAPEGAVARAVGPGYALRERHLRDDPAGLFAMGDFAVEGRVAPDGTFTLEALPAGARLRLELLEGRTVLLTDPDVVTLSPEEVRRVEWDLLGGVALECRVRDEAGAARENVEVWLVSPDVGRPGPTASYWKPTQQRLSDAEGRLVFDDVQPGRWIVGLSPAYSQWSLRERAEPSWPTTSIAVDVRAAGSAPVELTLHDPRTISGSVADPTGGPQRASVLLRGSTPASDFTAQADEDGRFETDPLPPGRYTLTAELHRQKEVSLAPSAEVQANAGDDDVLLELRAGAGFVARGVDAASGSPTEASFAYGALERVWRWYSYSRPEKALTVRGLEPGAYFLVARTKDGRAGIADVRGLAPNELREVDVQLVQGGEVRVRYSGTEPVLGCSVMRGETMLVATTATSGGEARMTLPPGLYTFVGRTRDRTSDVVPSPISFEESREIDVVAGETVEISIER